MNPILTALNSYTTGSHRFPQLEVHRHLALHLWNDGKPPVQRLDWTLQHLLLWRPRGSCANPLETWLWNREAFCKGFQNPWEGGPLEAGSDCGFMLLGLWLYLKLPHAFFRSNTTITTSTNTPCRTPILTNKLWHKNLILISVGFAFKYSFEFRWLLPFSLIDCLWFSSVPVEFTHYQLRTAKNITNQ